MITRRFPAALAVLILALGVAGPVHAAPYFIHYNGIIGTFNPPQNHFPEVNEGEAYSITLVFDNGGGTAASQIWSANQLTCIIFVVNDAGDVQYAQDMVGTELEFSNGQIATNGSGTLTGMFIGLVDLPVEPGTYSTTGFQPEDEVGWFLNGFNDIFVGNEDAAPNIKVFGDAAGGVQMDPADWTNPAPFDGECAVQPPAPPVPIPVNASWALLLLAALALLLGIRSARRAV